MADLVVRGDSLHRRAGALRVVATELGAAQNQADDAAGAVGHPSLECTVRDFGSQWDLHRQRLIDDVTTLANIVEAIRSTMSDLERDLASRLRDGGARMPAPTTGVMGSVGP